MTSFFSTLSPDWTIPNVKAYTILTSASDFSPVTFSHDNFQASHCREQLELLTKPLQPICWLRQVHGNRIVEMPVTGENIEADGAFTHQKNIVCAIMTADCLPIIFSNQSGTQVGVVHAGRKGLQKGIISEMINTFDVAVEEIYAWIGPGIAAESYPISKEIKAEVLALSSSYEKVFSEGLNGQPLMDLYEVARMQLANHGIINDHISGASWDTFTDERFHSARRDKDKSGRMATIVWME